MKSSVFYFKYSEIFMLTLNMIQTAFIYFNDFYVNFLKATVKNFPTFSILLLTSVKDFKFLTNMITIAVLIKTFLDLIPPVPQRPYVQTEAYALNLN